MNNLVKVIFLIVFAFSCIEKSKIKIKRGENSTFGKVPSVSTIVVRPDHRQLTLAGANLDGVTNVQVTGPGINQNFEIDSQNSSQLQFSALIGGLKFVAGAAYNIVLSTAQGNTTIPIEFSPSTTGASNGDILQFDGTNWNPVPMPAGGSGLNLIGSWNAGTNSPSLADGGANTTPVSGDYYIVGNAGATSLDGKVGWQVGDWVIFNGSTWDKISNSVGNIGNANITDVNVSKIQSAAGEYFGYLPNNVACADGEILEWDNTNSRWICGIKTVDTDSNAGTLCNAGEYLDGDGTCKVVSGANTNAATICSPGEFLNGDGSCDPVIVDTNTNADTLCNANEYLDGDGTCKAIPVDTNTNAGTLCNAGEYLDGDTTCKAIPTDTTLAGSAAGGSLSGTYPNPTIAAQAVTNTMISGIASNCSNGQVLKADGSGGFTCAADAGAGGADASSLRGETLDASLATNTTTDGQILVWSQTNSRWEVGTQVTDTDTNAQSICTGATFLDGDGNCTAMPTDTTLSGAAAGGDLAGTYPNPTIAAGAVGNAEISDVNVGKIANNAGEYFVYRPNNVACADGQVMQWDNTNSRWACGNKTVDTDTISHAGTICSPGEYLDGDSTCKTIPTGMDPSYGSAGGSPSDAVYVNATGLVGVGTTTPTNLLHISSPDVNDQGLILDDENGDLRAALTLGGTSGDRRGRFDLYDSDDNLAVRLNSEGNSWISSTGNMGLGTSSPLSRLHVHGGQAIVTANSNPAIRLATDEADVTDADRAFFGIATANNGFANGSVINDTILRGRASGKLHFAVGTTPYVTIQNNGDTGIGTLSPTEKLTVDGNINVTTGNDICIDGAGCLSAAVSGGGETNTASNLGTGSNVFKAKSAVDLQFRSIIGGAGVTATENANDITLSVTEGDLDITNMTGTLPVARGGTGATTAAAARTNLGLGSAAVANLGTASGEIITTDNIPNCLATQKLQMSAGPIYSWTCVADQTIADTNADTLCNAGEYLDGDGTCKTVPSGGDPSYGSAGGSPVDAVYVDASGRLGVGTTTPSFNLHSIAGIGNDRYTNGAPGAHYFMRKARGTEGTPLIVADNDEVSTLWGQGYDGNSFETSARIKFLIDGTPADGDMPGRIDFTTTPAGSTLDQTRMVIRQSGNVGIGVLAPTEKLEVGGKIKATEICDELGNCKDITNLSVSSGDNLGNHTATANIQTNGNWISNDGGAEGLFILANGNVSVGSNAPTDLFEVANINNSSGTPSITIRGTASEKAAFLGDISSTNLQESGQLSLFLNDTETVKFGAAGDNFINTTGSLAIGTTTASTKLHVEGASNIGLTLKRTDATNPVTMSTNASGEMLFYTGGSAKAVIEENGNFGIGTTAALEKLHVDGGVLVENNSGTNGLIVSRSTASDGTVPMVQVQTDSSKTFYRTYGDLVFQNGPLSGALSESMRVDTSGNLGIGTNAPSDRLTVRATDNLTTNYPVQLWNLSDTMRTGFGTYGMSNKIGTAQTIDYDMIIGGDLLLNPGDGVAINGSAADASAVLDVQSTTKGFLPPRMTEAERDAIPTPATGLTVYNTTSSKLNVYDGSAWSELTSNSAGSTIAFTVAKTANQTAAATPEVITWETAVTNKGSGFDLANNRFVAPEAGTYFFHADILGQNSSTSDVVVRIYKNGITTNLSGYGGTAGSVTNRQATVSAVLELNQNDYIDIRTENTRQIYGNATILQTRFSGYKITSGSGGGSGPATLISGWPDAIKCNVSGWGDVILRILHAPYTGNNYFYYRFINSGTNYDIRFNTDGTWAEDTIAANNCENKTISQLYTDGQAFNMTGASGSLSTDSVDSTHIQTDAVTTTEIADNTVSVADLDFASSDGINIPQLASDPAGGTAGQTYYNTTNNKMMFYNGSAWVEMGSGASGGGSGIQIFEVVDQKADATNGGTFTGGAWQTRDLNTVRVNQITGASLSSNQFTLPAGTYTIFATAPAYKVNRHQAKLYNVTDGADVLLGTSLHTWNTDNTDNISIVNGTFTIPSTKVFELRHRSNTTVSSNGFGVSSSNGGSSIFSTVQIKKFDPSVSGGAGSFGSTSDDLSDYVHHEDTIDSASKSLRTLVDITGESGTLMGGTVIGHYFTSHNGGSNYKVTIEVDGSSFLFPKATANVGYSQDAANNNTAVIVLPVINYSNSLKITYYYEGTNHTVNGYAMTSQTAGGAGGGSLTADSVDSSHVQGNSLTVADVDFASTDGINIPQLASDPAGGTAGQTYYNTTSNKVMYYNGSSWVEVGSGSGSGSSGLEYGWPDFIKCTNGNDVRFLNLSAINLSAEVTYRRTLSPTGGDQWLSFTYATKAYGTNTSLSGYDCLNKSIATLTAEGKAKFLGGGSKATTTSALLNGWPDAIVCTAATQVKVFYQRLNTSTGTNSDNNQYADPTDDGTTRRYVRFNDDQTYRDEQNATGYDCTNKPISQLVSEGKAKFFGNDIAAIAQDDDNDTKIMVEKNADEDKIRFDTAGSERMVIDETGKVGIGTSTSVHHLHVDDSSDQVSLNVGESFASTTDATGFGISPWDDNNIYLDSKLGTGGKLLFRYGEGAVVGSDSTWMAMDSGKVGIGTVDPLRNLHVQSSDAYGMVIENKTNTANATTGLAFRVWDDPAYTASKHAIMIERESAGSYSVGKMHFAVNNAYDGTDVSLSDSKITIDKDGNMGIGTTTPEAQLQVHNPSGTNATNKATLKSQSVLTLKPHATNSTNMNFAQVNNGTAIGVQVTNSAGTADWDIALNPFGGNVGIGTTSPSHLLHVNGVARSTSSSWATSSDRRVKENIENVEDGLDKIMALRPVRYNYVQEYVDQQPEIAGVKTGFIAQEVAAVDSTMVNYVEEKVGDDTIEDFNILSTDNMIPLLVAATQEQQKQIEQNLQMFNTMSEGIRENTRRIASLEEENREIKEENKQLRKDVDDLKAVVCSIKPEAKICQ